MTWGWEASLQTLQDETESWGAGGAKDLTYTFFGCKVFYRHFLFGKIKVRLRFRVRDNVMTMTHRGRHEQVTVRGVSLKYPNQT